MLDSFFFIFLSQSERPVYSGALLPPCQKQSKISYLSPHPPLSENLKSSDPLQYQLQQLVITLLYMHIWFGFIPILGASPEEPLLYRHSLSQLLWFKKSIGGNWLNKKQKHNILKFSSVYALYRNDVDNYRYMSIDKLIRIDHCTFAALLTHWCKVCQ